MARPMQSRLQPKTSPAAIETEPTAGPIGAQKSGPLLSMDSPLFKDVRVQLDVKLGAAVLSVAELLALKAGSVVKLDLKINDLVELHLNESLVARGEIVAVGD